MVEFHLHFFIESQTVKSTLRRRECAVLKERRLYGEGTIDLPQREVDSISHASSLEEFKARIGSPVTLT